jgi:phosphoribosylaminoimidazole-succinocarboxamide synthase
MIAEADLRAALPLAFAGLSDDGVQPDARGKVRDIYRRGLPARRGGQQWLLVTTDRLSAFDRVLGLVPYKGQVLNQLSAYWFSATTDIVDNHLVALPDPNVMLVRECQALPVEVIVRGYITGVTQTALWYRYSQGEREIYGYTFPGGLHKNEPLPGPIITPTTKGGPGSHDERLTCREVVEKGLVAPAVWERVQAAALALFQRGQKIARRGGLILVDTKYEFGLDGDRIVLIDEVHTPDSSRFWLADTYHERMAAGEEPDNFDKEFVRLWYAARGYRGDGEPPAWDAGLAVQASQRYVEVYQLLTGRAFKPAEYPAEPRIARVLAKHLMPSPLP